MQKYINNSNVPLSLGVFLATDRYDHNDDPAYISATSLIRPVRQLILASRVPQELGMADLGSQMQNRMGSAIHEGIEWAWRNNYAVAMRSIGIPQSVVDRIRINPKPEELNDEIIPVYMEQRLVKKFKGRVISGKFDFLAEGRLEDFKSTTTYTYVNQSNKLKHTLQMSIYRWLNPELITNDQAAINFIFTDWNKFLSMSRPGYPPNRFLTQILDLFSLRETEEYVSRKLDLLNRYWDSPESDIPLCDDDDLWRSEPQFKYYKNPQKTVRSTKNFETKQEALIRMQEDGNVGFIKEVPGQVTACKYCSAFPVCSQKDALIAAGDLIL